MKIYLTEKDQIVRQLWQIVFRAIGDIDDAGSDWFTVGNDTFIGSLEWHVSDEPEVARIVNAVNSLNGSATLIYHSDEEAKKGGRASRDQYPYDEDVKHGFSTD